MPSGHTGKSKDGSRKTGSSIRSGPITLTKNHQRSREKRPNKKRKSYVNCVGNVIVIS